jgi:glycosyltransferase involved in cell wall biosynthesis
MRILITQETDWLKRNPLQQHHLAELLSLRGHEIRVIDYELLWKTQGRKGLYSRRKIFKNVSKVYSGANITVIRPGVIKVPWLDYASLIFSHDREIIQQIREFKPDVIVGFGILNSYLAARAARKNSFPFIYHWLDVLHWLIPFKPFQPIGKMLESKVLKQADRVLVVSDKLKEFVIKLGAPPERVQIVKPGISLKQFNPTISGAGIRKKYGLKKDDIALFFMGWLYHFSGLKEVAQQLAGTKNHRLKFLIVGEGDAYDELRQIRRKYNLGDRVILTGKRPYEEMPALVAAADICLLPAYPGEKIMQDGLPGKIYEYMAMGKPMISTKLPGVMREFGQDNGVVYVDQPEDVVTEAIELVSQGKVKELGLKARTFVEQYSWDNITNEFERILGEVIKEKRNGTKSKRV